MCGILASISLGTVYKPDRSFHKLARLTSRRGIDSSGIIFRSQDNYIQKNHNSSLHNLITPQIIASDVIVAHARLATNGSSFGQPFSLNEVSVFHNGIVVNESYLWDLIGSSPTTDLDTEVIAALAQHYLESDLSYEQIGAEILKQIEGTASCLLLFPAKGKLLSFSNNGSLHFCKSDNRLYYSSESSFLESLPHSGITQVLNSVHVHDIPRSTLTTDHTINQRPININFIQYHLPWHPLQNSNITNTLYSDVLDVYFRQLCLSSTLIAMAYVIIAVTINPLINPNLFLSSKILSLRSNITLLQTVLFPSLVVGIAHMPCILL